VRNRLKVSYTDLHQEGYGKMCKFGTLIQTDSEGVTEDEASEMGFPCKGIDRHGEAE
jgi:hypothetical protein